MKTLLLTLLLIPAITFIAGAQNIQTELVAIEKRLWTAYGAKDPAPFQQNVTADYMQVVIGMAPVTGRDAVADAVAAGGCDLTDFEFQDVVVRLLTPDIALLCYTATQKGSCGDMPLPPKVYVTSLYLRQAGRWMSASYQETPIE